MMLRLFGATLGLPLGVAFSQLLYRSPLFGDSSPVYLIECLAISIALGAVFAAGQRAAYGYWRS